MTEQELPQGERTFPLPERKDVFKIGEKYFLYMGKSAGFLEAERLCLLDSGTVVGVFGTVNRQAAEAAAEKLLRERIHITA